MGNPELSDDAFLAAEPAIRSRLLSDFVIGTSKLTTTHELFTRLTAEDAPMPLWSAYVQERLSGAGPLADTDSLSGLERVLKEGQASAQKQGNGFSLLAKFMGTNFREERGLNAEGARDLNEAHGMWREDFRLAIGNVLAERGAPLEETTGISDAYTAFLGRLADEIHTKEGLYKAAGSVALLERIIADEYVHISLGLDRHFSLKHSERHYIDDHAHHDVRHAQEIVAGINQALKTESEPKEALSHMRAGMTELVALKADIFDGINAKVPA